jgi:hypothetical protein
MKELVSLCSNSACCTCSPSNRVAVLIVSAVQLNGGSGQFWNVIQVDSTFIVGTDGGAICKCRLSVQSADFADWDKSLKQTGGHNLQCTLWRKRERCYSKYVLQANIVLRAVGLK